MLSSSRFLRSLVALGCLGLFLGALAPLATAQAPVVDSYLQLKFTKPATMKPGETYASNLSITYHYNAGGASKDPTTVKIEVTSTGDFFTAKAEPDTVTFPAPHVGEDIVTLVTPFSLAVKPNATAFQKGNYSIKLTALPNGNVKGATTESTGDFTVTFVPKTTLTSPGDTFGVSGGSPTDVTFKVKNGANAEVKVEFEVEGGAATTTIPPPMTLAAGEEKPLTVTLRTPWTQGTEGDLLLKAKATPTAANETGDETSARVHFASTSAVPGNGFTAALGALGIAFVLLRRRLA